MKKRERILVCGILPPPYFGHSMVYKILMESQFVQNYDIIFFDIRFWTYKKHKKVTIEKLFKLVVYLVRYEFLILTKRPKYILYAMSFDKMPFLKDFLFCWVGRLHGCRIVLHDMGQYIGELYHSSNRFYQWLIKRLAEMVTASIVLGEDTKKKYDGFMDIRKIISVHGSVEDSRRFDFKQNPEDISRGNKVNLNVLYFSFLSRTKGIFTALKAVKEVVRKNSNIHFTFGGPVESENLQRDINRFVEENNLSSYVEFLGYVEGAEKRTEVFRQADIFVFPTHRDVFGLVLLHAMAEELPVIASIEGAISEIIVEGQGGFLFPKGDEMALAERILTLSEDAALRKRMGEANRKRYLEKFTPQCYGERMVQAFEEINQLVSY